MFNTNKLHTLRIVCVVLTEVSVLNFLRVSESLALWRIIDIFCRQIKYFFVKFGIG